MSDNFSTAPTSSTVPPFNPKQLQVPLDRLKSLGLQQQQQLHQQRSPHSGVGSGRVAGGSTNNDSNGANPMMIPPDSARSANPSYPYNQLQRQQLQQEQQPVLRSSAAMQSRSSVIVGSNNVISNNINNNNVPNSVNNQSENQNQQQQQVQQQKVYQPSSASPYQQQSPFSPVNGLQQYQRQSPFGSSPRIQVSSFAPPSHRYNVLPCNDDTNFVKVLQIFPSTTFPDQTQQQQQQQPSSQLQQATSLALASARSDDTTNTAGTTTTEDKPSARPQEQQQQQQQQLHQIAQDSGSAKNDNSEIQALQRASSIAFAESILENIRRIRDVYARATGGVTIIVNANDSTAPQSTVMMKWLPPNQCSTSGAMSICSPSCANDDDESNQHQQKEQQTSSTRPTRFSIMLPTKNIGALNPAAFYVDLAMTKKVISQLGFSSAVGRMSVQLESQSQAKTNKNINNNNSTSLLRRADGTRKTKSAAGITSQKTKAEKLRFMIKPICEQPAFVVFANRVAASYDSSHSSSSPNNTITPVQDVTNQEPNIFVTMQLFPPSSSSSSFSFEPSLSFAQRAGLPVPLFLTSSSSTSSSLLSDDEEISSRKRVGNNNNNSRVASKGAGGGGGGGGREGLLTTINSGRNNINNNNSSNNIPTNATQQPPPQQPQANGSGSGRSTRNFLTPRFFSGATPRTPHDIPSAVSQQLQLQHQIQEQRQQQQQRSENNKSNDAAVAAAALSNTNSNNNNNNNNNNSNSDVGNRKCSAVGAKNLSSDETTTTTTATTGTRKIKHSASDSFPPLPFKCESTSEAELLVSIIIGSILRTLASFHKSGLVHGNIKASNVFVKWIAADAEKKQKQREQRTSIKPAKPSEDDLENSLAELDPSSHHEEKVDGDDDDDKNSRNKNESSSSPHLPLPLFASLQRGDRLEVCLTDVGMHLLSASVASLSSTTSSSKSNKNNNNTNAADANADANTNSITTAPATYTKNDNKPSSRDSINFSLRVIDRAPPPEFAGEVASKIIRKPDSFGVPPVGLATSSRSSSLGCSGYRWVEVRETPLVAVSSSSSARGVSDKSGRRKKSGSGQDASNILPASGSAAAVTATTNTTSIHQQRFYSLTSNPTPSCDIWNIGLLLIELLLGSAPLVPDAVIRAAANIQLQQQQQQQQQQQVANVGVPVVATTCTTTTLDSLSPRAAGCVSASGQQHQRTTATTTTTTAIASPSSAASIQNPSQHLQQQQHHHHHHLHHRHVDPLSNSNNNNNNNDHVPLSSTTNSLQNVGIIASITGMSSPVAWNAGNSLGAVPAATAATSLSASPGLGNTVTSFSASTTIINQHQHQYQAQTQALDQKSKNVIKSNDNIDNNINNNNNNNNNTTVGFPSSLLLVPPPVLSTQFSLACRSFVAACCEINPLKRKTAEQLLTHPFLRLEYLTYQRVFGAATSSSSDNVISTIPRNNFTFSLPFLLQKNSAAEGEGGGGIVGFPASCALNNNNNNSNNHCVASTALPVFLSVIHRIKTLVQESLQGLSSDIARTSINNNNNNQSSSSSPPSLSAQTILKEQRAHLKRAEHALTALAHSLVSVESCSAFYNAVDEKSDAAAQSAVFTSSFGSFSLAAAKQATRVSGAANVSDSGGKLGNAAHLMTSTHFKDESAAAFFKSRGGHSFADAWLRALVQLCDKELCNVLSNNNNNNNNNSNISIAASSSARKYFASFPSEISALHAAILKSSWFNLRSQIKHSQLQNSRVSQFQQLQLQQQQFFEETNGISCFATRQQQQQNVMTMMTSTTTVGKGKQQHQNCAKVTLTAGKQQQQQQSNNNNNNSNNNLFMTTANQQREQEIPLSSQEDWPDRSGLNASELSDYDYVRWKNALNWTMTRTSFPNCGNGGNTVAMMTMNQEQQQLLLLQQQLSQHYQQIQLQRQQQQMQQQNFSINNNDNNNFAAEDEENQLFLQIQEQYGIGNWGRTFCYQSINLNGVHVPHWL